MKYDPVELSPQVNERISQAPNPSSGTIKRRQCMIIQLVKLAGFNLRILQLVTREKLHNR